MKEIHTWREPWKRSEPGARLSNKQKVNDARGQIERANMEAASSQDVKVVFDKFLIPRQISSFRVIMKLPLSSEEIMERMSQAFPELELKKGDV